MICAFAPDNDLAPVETRRNEFNEAGTIFLRRRCDHHARDHGCGFSSVLPEAGRHGRAEDFTAARDARTRSWLGDDRMADGVPGSVDPRDVLTAGNASEA